MIYKSITELIGKTPILRLNKLKKQLKLKSDIFAKLEYFNPAGSVKDRTALAMLQDAIKHKKIKKNTIIVEATSGNTGIGLASVCAALGQKLILVMPENATDERKKLLKAYGAEVILTQASKGMKGAIEKTNRLLKGNLNYITLDQFSNPANAQVHRETTGPEILSDMGKKIDYFISGVGTGGTITGTGEFLKQNLPNLQVLAVEPKESAVLSGNSNGPHSIYGIGAGFIPPILNTQVYDAIVQVSTEQAITMARLLAKTEGILVGISSGAALHSAVEIAKTKKRKNIVVLLPDTGERYLSTNLFDLL